MKQLAQKLSVTKAAKILRVSAMTLRRWEAQGLLIPTRSKGGARIYYLEDILSLKKGHNRVTAQKVVDKLRSNTHLKDAKSNFKNKPSFKELISTPSEFKHFYQILDEKTLPALKLESIKKVGIITILIPVLLTALVMGVTLPKTITKDQKALKLQSTSKPITPNSDVLGVTTPKKGSFAVNIPTVFSDDVTIQEAKLNAQTLELASDQLLLNSGGVSGTLTWTPTGSAKTITLPDTTDTLIGKTTTDTLKNKSISGSDNTLTSIPNSALSNSKVTVSAGTNISGGGDVSLGSSVTLNLKDSISLSGTLGVSGTTTLSGASTLTGAVTASSTLAVTGATTLSSTLAVTGTSTLSSTLSVSGASTLTGAVTTSGNVGVGSSLTATSAGVFSSGIKVSAHSDLATIGATTITATGLNLNLGSDATGDIYYRNSSGALTRLGIGSASQILQVSSGLPVWAANSSSTQWTTSSNDIYFIGAAGAGNVGIGNTYANYSKLQVTGSGTGTGIAFQTLDSSGTQRFSVLDNGNVGIGTTNPDYNFKTQGTGYFSGFVGVGSSLNVSGNVGVGGSITGFGALNGLSVTGLSSLAGLNTTTINGTTLTTTGNVSVGASLTSSSASILDSLSVTKSISGATLGISGASDLNTLTTTGNVSVGSSLTVTSAGVFSSTLKVSGFSEIAGLSASNINATTLTTTGNVGVGASITGFGALNGLNVTGLSSLAGLNTSGNVGIGSSLTVTSAGVFSSGIKVSGLSDLAALNATNINSTTLTTTGNVGVGGSITGYGALSGLNVTGLSSLAGLNTSGNIGVGTSLTVSSAAILDSLQVTKSISGATLGISGATTLTGNVGVGSSLTVTSAGVFSSGIKVSAHSDLATIGATTITATGLNLNLGSDATGDIYYRNSSGALTRLGIGSANQVLTVSSSLPAWATSTSSQWTSGTAGIYYTGNVGIGNTFPNSTTSPFAKLQLSGAGTSTGLNFLTTSSSGTQGLAVLDNGNVGIGNTNPSQVFQINVSSPLVFTSGGNLGIGFTSPDRLGQFASDIDITPSNSSLLGTAGTQFVLTGSTGAGTSKKLVFGLDTTDNYGVIQAGNTSGTSYNLIINPTGGNIGIGTSSPTSTLEISGTTPTFRLADTTTTGATVTATGGTITYSGSYTIHTFTSSGTFTPDSSANVEVLVVGGGGGGSSGGGGAGGYRTNSEFAVTAQGYTVTVGAGGNGGTVASSAGSDGSSSTFSTITSAGGGGGGYNAAAPTGNGRNGGSGGGAGAASSATTGGTGNTPSTSPSQGNDGGANHTGASSYPSGGGGGSGGAGGNASAGVAGTGGSGTANSISGSSVTYAAGGAGALYDSGGAGAAGTANSGNGGGGGTSGSTGGNGGSGIVIIRYLTNATPIPIALLGINSSGIFDLRSSAKTAGSLLNLDLANTKVGIGTSSPTGFFQVNPSGGASFVVTSAGNVGIGNTTPRAALQIGAGIAAGGSYSVITSSGNVGIGTTSPNFALSGIATRNSANAFSLTNLSTTADSSTSVLRLNIGTATSDTSARWLEFYGASTLDNNGTRMGRVQLNNTGAAYNTGNADFAEYFDVIEPVANGDLVGISSLGNRKARKGDKLIGVVTDSAGFIGNAKVEAPDDTHAIVGLVGQIKTHISTENGPIKRGDYLTISSRFPGIAVKAVKPGEVVGRALEDYNDDSIGKIWAYIKVGFADPNDIFSKFDVDESGNLIIPQAIKTSQIIIDESLGQQLTTTALVKNPLYAASISPISEKNYRKIIQISDNELGFLRVREKPSTESLELAKVKPNDKFLVLDQIDVSNTPPLHEVWYQINYTNPLKDLDEPDVLNTDGKIGWVKESYTTNIQQGLSLKESTASASIKVTDSLKVTSATSSSQIQDQEENVISKPVKQIKILSNELGFLRVREKPSTESEELARLQPGVILDILDQDPASASANLTWYQVDFKEASPSSALNNSVGWVKGSYVSISTPSASISTPIASASADILPDKNTENLKLTPPDILLATGSAQLANLKVTSEASISGLLTSYDLNISNQLKSLGTTTLAKTNINGDLTIDGTLTIENGSQLNVIGTLFLQKSPLASLLDIFNSKVIIDNQGNIITQGNIIAKKVIIDTKDIKGATLGSAKLPANTKLVEIETSAVTEKSRIFITPTTTTNGQSLIISSKKSGYSFDVSIDQAFDKDILFDWLIVDELE